MTDHEVVATSGGPHPPSMWARITANRILSVIQVADTAPDAMIQKAQLEVALLGLLIKHHTAVQQAERAHLDRAGSDHLDTPYMPGKVLEDAVADVQSALQDTLFEEHFKQPEMINFLEQSVGSDMATAMHIERQWYSHANKDADERAASYLTR